MPSAQTSPCILLHIKFTRLEWDIIYQDVKGDSPVSTEKKCIGTFSDERDTEVYKIIQKWEGDGPRSQWPFPWKYFIQ